MKPRHWSLFPHSAIWGHETDHLNFIIPTKIKFSQKLSQVMACMAEFQISDNPWMFQPIPVHLGRVGYKVGQRPRMVQHLWRFEARRILVRLESTKTTCENNMCLEV